MSGLLLSRMRTLACATLLITPACVIKLADRNSAINSGGVTGEALDCSQVQPLGKGEPGGNAETKYVGRFVFRDAKRVAFDWSGNYVEARFQGSEVTAGLEPPTDDPRVGNDVLFTYVIDDLPPQQIQVTPGRAAYTLAEGLDPNVPHQVILHRDTEAQKGIVTFTGFDFGAGGKPLPPVRRPRRIEIIGDSITCGYGILGENATCPFDIAIRDSYEKDREGKPIPIKLPKTENQYLSYSTAAARKLDADIVTVCWSGKGVVKNYKDNLKDKDGLVTIPQLWRGRGCEANVADCGARCAKCADCTAKGEECAGAECAACTTCSACLPRSIGGSELPVPDKPAIPAPPWDFTKEKPEEQPQIVVINLGTNDFARDTEPPAPLDKPDQLPGDNIPDGTIDRQVFRDVLRDFVVEVRKVRPQAHILLAVPPMLTNQFPLPDARDDHRGLLMSVMEEFKSKGDQKIDVMDLVEQGFRYGLGCDYHPNLEVHRLMAEQLEGAIRSKTCW